MQGVDTGRWKQDEFDEPWQWHVGDVELHAHTGELWGPVFEGVRLTADDLEAAARIIRATESPR